jgi:hypothetical protein
MFTFLSLNVFVNHRIQTFSTQDTISTHHLAHLGWRTATTTGSNMKRNTNKVRSDPERCSISVKAVSIASSYFDDVQKTGFQRIDLELTLLDHHVVVMRCASRYDDVGPLRYHQHPLFFQTMEPLQLAQIEDNSPVSRCSAFISITISNKCSLGWIENDVSLRS